MDQFLSDEITMDLIMACVTVMVFIGIFYIVFLTLRRIKNLRLEREEMVREHLKKFNGQRVEEYDFY